MEDQKNSIWYKIGLFFCWIFNLSPFFHVSRDEEFDSVSRLENLRFSILSLPFGDKYLYFITLSKDKGLERSSILRISDLQVSRSKEKLDILKTEFLELSDNDEGLNSQLRIEFLKHKHTSCQNSINTLNNKVNSYIAIALVYVGLCVFLFKSILGFPVSVVTFLVWVIFTIYFIFLVNILLLLRRYLQVKAVVKSVFSSFKENPDWKTLAANIYIDWLTSKEEQLASATLVKNIEKYFVRSVVLSVLLLIMIVLQPYAWSANQNSGGSYKSSIEFVLLDGEGSFSPQELLKLSKAITPDNKVTFIYSSSNTIGKTTTDFAITALKLTEQSMVIELSDHLFDTKVLIANIERQK